ncbi:putative GNAT family acetyltransferase [Nitrospirillum amazonense]|uniref:Putative GNAT family acetyltransferase n=1 Tax=Nitrospirillum amazonense TaxID=28077 RepID=A0A560EXS9_9PROT|nr:GNAT family N-acetyltransferase [Nitrospirillum amazonense]TWB14181.1 putative GNAT family acetyltransferase [Nitrospirillum amazonense]
MDPTVADLSLLDNPVWNALTTAHHTLGQVRGLAARYQDDISPLAGLAGPTAAALANLAALVPSGRGVGVVSPVALDIPTGAWQVLRAREIDQMVCEALAPQPATPAIRLTAADVPDMVDLAKRTEPGPFLDGTIRMGAYFGLRSPDGRLMAMTGQRMRLPGLREVSAVCTDPDFRGRGLALALVSAVAAGIIAEGEIPFLHVKTENEGAKRVYEKLGFRVRRAVHFIVLRRL